MTDFLNDLIARSAGKWEAVRPRPVSVFEPVEPGTGPFGAAEAEVAALGDDDTANQKQEAADVAPTWPQVKAEDDTAAANPTLDSPDIPAAPVAVKSDLDLPEPTPRAAQRRRPARPDEPQQRRRFDPEARPADGRAGELSAADMTPALPKDDRPPAALAVEAARPPDRDGAPRPGQPVEKRSDDEDALADILRRLIVPQYVRAAPGPDGEAAQARLYDAAPSLLPLAAEPGEAQSSAGAHPRQPRPPAAAEPEAATRSLRHGRQPEARVQSGENTRRRVATTQRSDGLASTWLSPLPEPILHFPADRHAETSVHITIGRIEVRAIMGGQEAPAPRRPQPTLMSLDDYLKQRSAGDG